MISFQQLFSDLSSLLIVFPDISAETTVEELLIWLKNILESAADGDVIEFVMVKEDEN